MNFEKVLDRVEGKWLQNAFEYIQDLFTKHPLPSHDESHHWRVWKYLRSFLTEVYRKNIQISESDIEILLLSSLFHDSGLTVTKAADHGLASAEICRDFLKKQHHTPEDLSEILLIIEKHDDKTYHQQHPLIKHSSLNLLSALGVCDDLDAFGHLGIYRYIEIYLMRGIPFDDLGLKIRANLSGRFQHFIASCNEFSEFTATHEKRYQITDNFFKQYNQELEESTEAGISIDTPYIRVARVIYREVLKGPGSLREIQSNIIQQEEEPFIQYLFKEIGNEYEFH